MLPNTTDVLIVGAGPTGTALAIGLRQAGIDHVVIDKLPEGQNTSRAAVVHAHTLEMLRSLGVSAAMAQRGIRLTKFTIRDRDRALVRLRFDQLPSDYAYLLMLPQDETERVLHNRLSELGGAVHRGITATAIAEEGERVRVAVASREGESVV